MSIASGQSSSRSLFAWLCLSSSLAFAAIEAAADPGASATSADDLLIVDCALPGQIRQLGNAVTYVAPRRPERTTALDCRIRGGEYVVHDRANLGTALAVWLDEAKRGDPEAQTTVGELFERGLGTQPDHATAADWYRLAAEAGHARAQVNLGNLYERGLGVPVSPETALQWYRRAAGLPAAIALESVPGVAPASGVHDPEIARLNQRIAELEARSAQLADELELTRRALREVEAQAGAAAATQAERATVAERLSKAQAHLREQNLALEQQSADYRQELDTLRAELERVRLAPPPTAPGQPTFTEARPGPATAQLAGPEIVLIEPRVGETRGLVKISVPVSGELQQIVGRASAPAGLLSISVNGTPVSANAAGVFSTAIPVDDTTRDVIVTAIDQQGRREDLTFALAPQALIATAQAQAPATGPPIVAANYHALLIGNDDYARLPDLKSPIADVERVERILRERYGFRTRVLRNATRYDTLSALNELRAELTPDDNLVLYYAGHGELDEANMRGHWLPVDAEAESTANWLSNVDVTDILNVIRARQVLLVVDSCYSGTLTRSGLTRLDTGLTPAEQTTWLRLMAEKRARVVLTSGGIAPVLDFGGGRHSVFARAFIEALETNTEVLPGRNLFQAVAARVAHAAAGLDFEQIPQYAPIARAGHEAGDFILQPRL